MACAALLVIQTAPATGSGADFPRQRQRETILSDSNSMEPVAILAATHEVALTLEGEAGGFYIEQRTVGVPDDDLLGDLAAAARRTYERLHGVAPERMEVYVAPMTEEERDRERRRVERDLDSRATLAEVDDTDCLGGLFDGCEEDG